ncbi:hypothetical protein [Methylobacterium sp. Leaf100]|uniref:hypothetical protein n=1 Tax=Methylobacterium sp. Leaf100 TaxID=1736252 RepID=UPI0006F2474C|nr:hypothetical protein [Methylobacterium sp. Leaf100]KQP36707.1 hypothetical protein ASF25_01760 [Methylobacterium sp. Leaf100]
MALDLTLFDAGIQASINALPATPDPKALLLIGKAIESTRPTVAVSDLLAASVSQQAIIVAVRASAITAINAARDQALVDIQNAGQGSAAASGITFAPVGGIAATNVQGAIAEVDAEASKRGANLSDLADPAAARQNLALRPGFEVQPYDADLAAIAALTTTALGRSLLAIADAAAGRNVIGAVSQADLTAAVQAIIGMAPSDLDTLNEIAGRLVANETSDAALVTVVGGKLAKAQNLADLVDKPTARTNLGLGAVALLSAINAANIADASANGRSLLTATDYAAMRGLLALVIGTNVQAWDADLDAIAALTTTAYGRGLLTLTNAAALASAAGVPGKAAGTDLRTLTDDAKFLTAKSMADAMAYTSPAWAATFIPDWGTNGFRQSIVATGNTTLGGPFIGGKDGEDIALEFAQDATGGRTLALNTTYFKIPTGLTITASTAASAVDLVTGYLRMVGGTLVLQVTGFLKGAR